MKIPQLTYVGEKIDFIVRSMRDRGVLHLGCVDFRIEDAIKADSHVHLKLLGVTKELWGIDLNLEGIEHLRSHFKVEHLIVGDVEHLDRVDLDHKFEVVFAGELIEHLNNPGLFLEGVKRFMIDDGILLLTTPLGYSLKTFIHLLSRSEKIESDHTLVFTFSTLSQLLNRFGFEITRWCVASETQRSSRSAMLTPLFNLVYRVFPQYSDKLVVFCRLMKGYETRNG